MDKEDILKVLEEIRDIQKSSYNDYLKNTNELLSMQRESFLLQKEAIENQAEAIEQQKKAVRMQSTFGRLYRIVIVVVAVIFAILVYKLYSFP